jgi:nicotinate-nucleotide--dimethylbenzimidazole phosphoribosyltransferase
MKQWYTTQAGSINYHVAEKARAYQATLTKPQGSLGQLESIAEQFCAWQGTLKPSLNKIKIVVFAGDHGVCDQGVSAFPQAVTAQMITNFLDGGAAISVLSRDLSADFSVVNMGIAFPLPDNYSQHEQLRNIDIAPGTADFSFQPAMTNEELEQALSAGRSCVEAQANNAAIDLFIGGEMGIGNTTSASAIYAAVLSLSPADVIGPGTGVDADGLRRKQVVVEKALRCHQAILHKPYEVLRCLGGLEIAGLVGAYIAAAQKGIPVLVDGFICTAAALIAVKLNASVRDWLFFSHQSAEPAHITALKALDAEPLLQLGLRLGEGSGAALAVPLLKSALSLYNNMATFTTAGVRANGKS